MESNACPQCGSARPAARRIERSPADVVTIQALKQEVQLLRETVARMRGSLGMATRDLEHHAR